MQGSKGGAYEFNLETGLQKLNPALIEEVIITSESPLGP